MSLPSRGSLDGQDLWVMRPSVLPDRIYASLKHRILTCDLYPGQRLIEKILCEQMRVSRTPLRESLNRLALEGLVHLVPFRGYAVAPITVEDTRNLCELRVTIESAAAGFAAKRATREDVKRLKKLADLKYRPGRRDTYSRYLRANSAFHIALAQCTRNQRLKVLIESVLDQLQRPLYLGLDIGLDSKSATAEHMEIVAAIQARHARLARKLMTEQVGRTERRILAVIGRLEPEFCSLSSADIRIKNPGGR